MRFCLFYGSYREPRMGIRLAVYLKQQIEKRGHEVDFIDARALNLPILTKRFSDYEKGTAPADLEQLSQTLLKADGFVMISGEYNHGVQPGLKNLLDHFHKEFFFRPSALAFYSISDFGGVRSESHLLQSCWALHMPPIPAFLAVPRIQQSFSEDGVPADSGMDGRAEKFIAQLEWYARALKAEREENGLPN